MSDYRRGLRLVIRFTDHFNTQLVITFNYSPIANFPTLELTRARANPFPPRSVFNSICLVTAPNNDYSPASGLKSSLNGESQLNYSYFNCPLHGPSRKHRFRQYLYRCMRIRCRENLFIEPLPRKGSTRYNTFAHSCKPISTVHEVYLRRELSKYRDEYSCSVIGKSLTANLILSRRGLSCGK
jgi:hypothetical protein